MQKEVGPISALDRAANEWIAEEFKVVSKRNFEFAKFFFSASVATVGVFPFLKEGVPVNAWQSIGLLLVLLSLLLAICVAEPAHFDVTKKTNPYEEQRKYARYGQRMRYAWFVCWALGVFLLALSVQV